MEASEKVREYLFTHVGHLVTAGRGVFDTTAKTWQVPVLCRTPRGILIVSEFLLDEDLDFLRIPSREEMLRVLRATKRRIPALVYADEARLQKAGLRAVAV
jgi:hypothetical protein